jgi:hypothetical protein
MSDFDYSDYPSSFDNTPIDIMWPNGTIESGSLRGEIITIPSGKRGGANTSFSIHSPARIVNNNNKSNRCCIVNNGCRKR